MLAVYAARSDRANPLSALEVGQLPQPRVPAGWCRVAVRAASLNHHDVWSLRGVGLPADRLPMILGCDAAGIDEHGHEVIVHALVGNPEWRGDETFDPDRTLLSELHAGTFAAYVTVPRRNLVPKPSALTFEEAACLPTAWLTAYRMLFVNSGLQPGQTVLVQGVGGGVASAAIALAHGAGIRVWATSRDETKRRRALELGAEQAFETGVRLPERVDAVIETVGDATWGHSLRSLRPGGTVVVAGATSGASPSADLSHVFFRQLRVVGSTMGTRQELGRLACFCADRGVRPLIDRVTPLSEAREGFGAMLTGAVHGKIVFRI